MRPTHTSESTSDRVDRKKHPSYEFHSHIGQSHQMQHLNPHLPMAIGVMTISFLSCNLYPADHCVVS